MNVNYVSNWLILRLEDCEARLWFCNYLLVMYTVWLAVKSWSADEMIMLISHSFNRLFFFFLGSFEPGVNKYCLGSPLRQIVLTERFSALFELLLPACWTVCDVQSCVCYICICIMNSHASYGLSFHFFGETERSWPGQNIMNKFRLDILFVGLDFPVVTHWVWLDLLNPG